MQRKFCDIFKKVRRKEIAECLRKSWLSNRPQYLPPQKSEEYLTKLSLLYVTIVMIEVYWRTAVFASETCVVISRAFRQTRLFDGTLSEIITHNVKYLIFISSGHL